MGCTSSTAANAGAPRAYSKTEKNKGSAGLGHALKDLTKEAFLNNDLRLNLVDLQEADLWETYELVRVIGAGSIGEVSIVRRKKPQSTGDPMSSSKKPESKRKASVLPSGKERVYALKSVYVNRMDKSLLQEFENEIQVLRQLHHPNIIQLREVYHFDRKIYLLMDLCSGGQLNKRVFTEREVCEVATQILRALVYMHNTAGICHRDLKMENVMLVDPAPAPVKVQLIDFGLSQVFTKGERMRTACGTVYTMAPEMMSGEGYTFKADVWSVGVIVFALLALDYPFLRDEEDLANESEVRRLKEARYEFQSRNGWDDRTEHVKTLIKCTLTKGPEERWSAKEALRHCEDVWSAAFGGSDGTPTKETVERAFEANDDEEGPGASPAEPQQRIKRTSSKTDVKLTEQIAKSMTRFANYGELKRAALMVTAFQLEREEIENLKDAFLDYDTEKNGVISFEELREVLASSGVAPEDIARIFEGIDQDQSGKLHYMEFLAASLEARGVIEEELIDDVFARLDTDNTGRLTFENLRQAMGNKYTDDQIHAMIKEADEDSDGEITMEEFRRFMQHTSSFTTTSSPNFSPAITEDSLTKKLSHRLHRSATSASPSCFERPAFRPKSTEEEIQALLKGVPESVRREYERFEKKTVRNYVRRSSLFISEEDKRALRARIRSDEFVGGTPAKSLAAGGKSETTPNLKDGPMCGVEVTVEDVTSVGSGQDGDAVEVLTSVRTADLMPK